MRTLRALLCAALAALLCACSFEPDYDKYAIVYGISDYQGLPGLTTLSWCDEDANDMASLFAAQGYNVIVQVSADGSKDATYDRLQADLGLVANAAGSDDLFVFYFSGHGGPVPSAGALEDAAGADPADEAIALFNLFPTEAVYYRDDQLAADLQRIRARQKVVIIDACNSAGFIGNQLEHDAVPADYGGSTDGFLTGLIEAISLYGSFDGYGSDVAPGNALVLAAAGEREPSYEGYYGHGVFTYFLLQAPARGDANGDGWVTVRETHDYVRRRIDANWNRGVYDALRFAPHVSGGPVDYVLFQADR